MTLLKPLLLTLGILLLASCASGPELQKYPRTQIERPYTLPKGVATWETLVPVGYFKDDTDSSFLPPIPFPIFWQSSLSDKWTLNWLPLPLSVSHQFSYSNKEVWGTTFGSGFGYASSLGWIINPSISFYQRTKIGEHWALETTPSFSGSYRSKRLPWAWSAGLSVGPLFQLTDFFALTTKVGIVASRGYQENVGSVGAELSPEDITRITFPLSIKAEWSFHRQWDFNASYQFQRLGHSKNYTAHIGLLDLVHYW